MQGGGNSGMGRCRAPWRVCTPAATGGQALPPCAQQAQQLARPPMVVWVMTAKIQASTREVAPYKQPWWYLWRPNRRGKHPFSAAICWGVRRTLPMLHHRQGRWQASLAAPSQDDEVVCQAPGPEGGHVGARRQRHQLPRLLLDHGNEEVCGGGDGGRGVDKWALGGPGAKRGEEGAGG